jgi:hypothetical protein
MPPNFYYNNAQAVNAAPLIADVGRRLNMKYEDDGSGAPDINLVNNVFPAYNISCNYSPYNTTYIKSSLSNGMPVILEAYYNDGTENVGHNFITDRYKSVQQIIKNTYFWVWDYIPPLTPLPVIDDKIEYTYSSPLITMIGMNWGWGYNSTSEWYSLTGDWIKGTHNWNIDRRMIYGFQVANNN